jgi:hypothetical protein
MRSALLILCSIMAFGFPAQGDSSNLGNPSAAAHANAQCIEATLEQLDLQKHRESFRSAVENGKIKIKVAELSSYRVHALAALAKVIRSGLVESIDAGAVVGPKVPHFLIRLGDFNATGNPIVIKGDLRVYKLMETAKNQQEKTSLVVEGTNIRDPEYWTDKDKEEFKQALDRLGVLKACKKIFNVNTLEECGKQERARLSFEYDIRHPENIVWTRKKEALH